MRVGYLTGTYPRVSDTFIQREVAALRDLGIEVETFSVRAPEPEHLVGPEQRAEHARTHYLLPARPAALLLAHLRLLLAAPQRYREAVLLALSTRAPGLRAGLKQLAYLAEAGLLAQAARRRRLDHLHNHFGDSSGSVTMLASALSGLPFSMTVHGSHIFFERDKWRLDVKAERAAFTVGISHFARSQVMAVAPPSSWPRIHRVHCGVVPSAYLPPVDEPGRLRLLAVGRLTAEKGLPLLLEAVARLADELPALRLDLVGDGPERPALEEQARALGIADRVGFLGSRSQAAVREELRRCDALVLASFAEGLPVVLMEAFASATPVVATRIMGVPELVAHEVNGLLVPPGDVTALAAALRRLAEVGPERRREWGAAGRAVVEQHFDVAQEAARLAALLRGEQPAPREDVAPQQPAA